MPEEATRFQVIMRLVAGWLNSYRFDYHLKITWKLIWLSGLELVSRSTYVCHLVMLPLFDTINK